MSYGNRASGRGVHDFASVEQSNIPYGVINRTHTHKTAFNHGQFIPVYCEETLAGDRFNLKIHALCRLATPVKPIFDNIDIYFTFFYVRNRVLFTRWRELAGERKNPDSSISDIVTPHLVAGAEGVSENSLADYFGIPTKVPNITFNALPFRATNLIWNEYMRAPYLQDQLPTYFDVDTDVSYADQDGNDIFNVLTVNKKSDYFTRSLPNTQAGDPVGVSFGDRAPLHGIVRYNRYVDSNPSVHNDVGSQLGASTPLNINSTNDWGTGQSNRFIGIDLSDQDYTGVSGLDYTTPYADLSSASSILINQIRFAFQDQKLRERDMRGGMRYFEIINSHFHVSIPDAMIERPDLIGIFKQSVVYNPVANTGASAGEEPQGNLAAVSFGATSGRVLRKYCEDYGWIIGFCYTKANLSYQQGLHKKWSRRVREDYYLPVLSHIGEQPILNSEIYAQGTGVDQDIFGYQEAWSEYKYGSRLITAEMRSNHSLSLDYWHLAQDFGELPTLSPEFIEEDIDVGRTLAVPTEKQYLLDLLIEEQAKRPMPLYSTPGLVDHF